MAHSSLLNHDQLLFRDLDNSEPVDRLPTATLHRDRPAGSHSPEDLALPPRPRTQPPGDRNSHQALLTDPISFAAVSVVVLAKGAPTYGHRKIERQYSSV